ncbi:MAG: hypothetical protein R3345_13280 [Fulvivirga sp.]|nr:hypothetical protein [Fulvivirga sp.]
MSKRNKTGEYDLFKEIWDERAHKCVICNDPLHFFNVCYFAHVLGKGAYPELRMAKKNIVIMCFDHHQIYDHHTHKAKEDKRFNKIFKLKDELKQTKR